MNNNVFHVNSGVVANSASVLSLYQQGLSELPEAIWQQTALEVLNAADNALVALPDGIGNLVQLRMLDVGHNQLRALPDALEIGRAHV